MARTLHLAFASAADLSATLAEHTAQQAVLIPLPGDGEAPEQFERLVLSITAGGAPAEVRAEALQILGPAGLVVRLPDPGPAQTLCRLVRPAAEPAAIAASWEGPPLPTTAEQDLEPDPEPEPAPEEAGPTKVKGHQLPPGMSPRNWPIEKLRTEWRDLTVPQQIQVARHGGKGARRMLIRMTDKKMHHFVLLNPHVTVDEVGVLAGNPSLDPELVRRIANSPEWTRHASIARNLICHPRLPIPMANRLVEKLNINNLRRLARSGRLRAGIKRLVVKKLDRNKR